MDDVNVQKIMGMTVKLVCDKLTDDELSVLGLVALLDQNPHGRLFEYKKVSSLFTQDNGTKMHEETKAALDRVILARLD